MDARIPCSTYRLQLQRKLNVAEVERLLDYLDTLGISDVYLSPVLTARPGSEHGYDVVDPERINPELGGDEGFVSLAKKIKNRGMGLLLDIVPNHMCIAGGHNRMWMDVLENGSSSAFASFFDIDWTPPKRELEGRVLLPILGDQYGTVLESQELSVQLRDGVFELKYFDTLLPLAPRSWLRILERALAILHEGNSATLAGAALLESIMTALRYLPARNETDPARLRERQREKEVVKARLAALVEETPLVSLAIQKSLAELNGHRGDPRSFDQLDALLDDQAYRLAFWRVAADEINYRRFFDINELAAIRVEDPVVFSTVHATIARHVKAGHITGLRIDHVDGLFDPARYFGALQSACATGLTDDKSAERPSEEPGPASEPCTYVVAEKILADGEALPQQWPIHGTTGYDFLNLVGGILVDQEGARRLHEIYRAFTGQTEAFDEVAYECKKLILRHSMASQVAMLAYWLDRISEQDRHSRDFTFLSLQDALQEVLACFPVYRTYVRPDGTISDADRRWIEQAVAGAVRANPAASESVFAFLRNLLLGEHPPGLGDREIRERQDFVLRLQQISGAVMAKAVEDTAFYRFFPLASRGEVGGTPDHPGVTIEEFHRGNQERLCNYPYSLLATTTHDTKRSEDARARIRVLSEQSNEWSWALSRFRALNARYRQSIGGLEAPDANEEYLFYQTMVGTWPSSELSEEECRMAAARIGAYMQKALREAKVHSSWVSPHLQWEQAVASFVDAVLEPSADNAFLPAFLQFLMPIARAGMCASLSQLVLKMTCPGVPDFYQGNELWDLSLVDPDNRRPVDFELRRQYLSALDREAAHDLSGLVQQLMAAPEDGRVKLHVTARGLRFRRARCELFDHGEYVPLDAEGPRANHIVAFARGNGTNAVIVAVGRHFLSLGAGQGLPIGNAPWQGTTTATPQQARNVTYRDVLTGTQVTTLPSGRLDMAETFSALPVAILEPAA
jgi:(1->4)-alpha-D-glucan 1-alpha-D-glucosylmutase